METISSGLNSPGQVLWNENIGVQFSILSGSETGTVIYKETHATSTDEFGMFDLVIGQGLVQGTQSFNMIDWGSGYHFLGSRWIRLEVQTMLKCLINNYGASLMPCIQGIQAVVDMRILLRMLISLVMVSLELLTMEMGPTFTYYDGSTYTTTVLSGLGGVGPQGPAGADGQDGQDGLSAYEIWLAQGNTGTEQDFLNGLIGPQGVPGNDGLNGIGGGNRKAIGTVGAETWSVPGWSIEYTTGNYIYANRVYYTPIYVSDTTTYTGLGIQMGSNINIIFDLKVGLYSWSNGFPDTLVAEIGTFETNIPAGHTISNSFTLNPGYYFLSYAATYTSGTNQAGYIYQMVQNDIHHQ